jgi:hypothetical protein
MATIVFEDRKATKPNRYRVTPENGEAYYVTLERADEPEVVGTALNAEILNQLTLLAESNLKQSGGTMAGAINMDGNAITGLASPVNANDVATKSYADGKIPAPAVVADMNTMTAFFGNVSATDTANIPVKVNGVALNQVWGNYQMQYIFCFSSPGRIVSRVKVDGAWSDWNETRFSAVSSTALE